MSLFNFFFLSGFRFEDICYILFLYIIEVVHVVHIIDDPVVVIDDEVHVLDQDHLVVNIWYYVNYIYTVIFER